jgi:hypothetical protein
VNLKTDVSGVGASAELVSSMVALKNVVLLRGHDGIVVFGGVKLEEWARRRNSNGPVGADGVAQMQDT